MIHIFLLKFLLIILFEKYKIRKYLKYTYIIMCIYSINIIKLTGNFKNSNKYNKII